MNSKQTDQLWGEALSNTEKEIINAGNFQRDWDLFYMYIFMKIGVASYSEKSC